MNCKRGKGFALPFLVAFLLLILVPGKAALADTVSLAWNANTEAVKGYKVYYGTSSRNYSTVYDVGNVLTFVTPNLGPGTYYFAVTAYNYSDAESTYSNEVYRTIGGTGSCSYSLSPTSQATGAAMSTRSVAVSTTSGCAWSASSNASWIGITSGSSGSGSGTVSYTVAVNATSSPRTGTLTVAGQTVTVTQAKAGCDITLDSNTNVVDIQVLINVVLGSAVCPASCDVNADGKVDVVDLQILQNVILGVRVCP